MLFRNSKEHFQQFIITWLSFFIGARNEKTFCIFTVGENEAHTKKERFSNEFDPFSRSTPLPLPTGATDVDEVDGEALDDGVS